MIKKVDSIIIGGGVIGSAIAYYLAKQGNKVILLEKEHLASQASGAAAGMLAAQAEMEQDGPMYEWAKTSRDLFPQLAKELKEYSGIDIGLIQKGLIKCARTPEEASSLKKTIQFQQASGAKVEALTVQQARELEPNLSDRFESAMYFPEDGQVSAPDVSLAFAKSAAHLGAELREFVEVKQLLQEGDRITGVMTEQETLYADQVILTSGAWSGHLMKQLGLELSIFPVKGELFSVIRHRPLITTTIFSHGCYIVPKRGGRLVVGATMVENTYDRSVSMKGLKTLMDRAIELLPEIETAEWEKAWSGLRPQTGDGLPYLGRHPQLDGLFVAAGHFRNGILLSPITGQVMSDLILRKPLSYGLSLDAFRLDRTGTKVKV